MKHNSAKGNDFSKIHSELKLDVCYQWSIDQNDIFNMQIVLRAYNFSDTFTDAKNQIEFAKAQ